MIQRLPAEMGSIPGGCNCRSSDCQQLNQIFGFVVSTSLLLTRYARTNLLTHREGKSVFAEQCYALFISSLPFVISVVDFSYFSSSTSFSSSSSFFFFLLQHPLLTPTPPTLAIPNYAIFIIIYSAVFYFCHFCK